MQFRPCIDLHNGKVKQIIGGSLTEDDGTVSVNFESQQDAAYYARLYRDDRLIGGHIIRLGPGNDAAAESALSAWPGGMQIGGGINTDNARHWLDAGAAQVILTSYIFADGELKQDRLEAIHRLVGRARLVLDLSCRIKDGRYYIVTDRWQKFTRLEVTEQTLAFLAGYCREFLIHAVDVEGRQAGIDTDLIGIMARHSPIPAVYAGGIRSLADIGTIADIGGGRIDFTVGSALDIFGGPLKYHDVVAYTNAGSGT